MPNVSMAIEDMLPRAEFGPVEDELHLISVSNLNVSSSTFKPFGIDLSQI
jgi:hypothetical protein